MGSITNLFARTVYDSRGIPTVEVELTTKMGTFVAMTECGTSIGKHEVFDLRDKDPNILGGKGVTKAVDDINNIIAPYLINNELIDVGKQETCDNALLELDGSQNKNKYGANGLLPVSIAICKAGAAKKKVPVYKHIGDLTGNRNFLLPIPIITMISGGKHSNNFLPFEGLMVIPSGAPTYKEALRIGAEIFSQISIITKSKHGGNNSSFGESGGLAADFNSFEECFELLAEAVKAAGFQKEVELAFDASASVFYKRSHEKYDLNFKNFKPDPKSFWDPSKLFSTYSDIIGRYQVSSIIDPFHQDHYEEWSKLVAQFPKLEIIGDDLIATNWRRIEKIGKKGGICSSFKLKLNQIGTVTEALQAFFEAKKYGWKCVASDRAGGSDDPFIVDLSIGVSTGKIHLGGLSRSEHVGKFNYLLKMEENATRNMLYAGSERYKKRQAVGRFSSVLEDD